jgi:hypothetical protein
VRSGAPFFTFRCARAQLLPKVIKKGSPRMSETFMRSYREDRGTEEEGRVRNASEYETGALGADEIGAVACWRYPRG